MYEGYIDLEESENLCIIHKSRKSNRGRNAGGGIAVVYNKMRIRLAEYSFKRGNIEIVCATGKIPDNPRKIAVIAAYIPPRNTAKQDKQTMECISDLIIKLKNDLNDPLILEYQRVI